MLNISFRPIFIVPRKGCQHAEARVVRPFVLKVEILLMRSAAKD